MRLSTRLSTRLSARLSLCRLACSAAVLLALAGSAPAQAPGEPAEAVIRAIYAQYGEGGVAFDVAERHFTPELLRLWRAAGDGVEQSLGFAIFTDAGEADIVDGVETQFISGRFVVASFTVIVEDERSIVGHKKHFMYTVAETPQGWKIDNIDWGRERPTLRDMLAEIGAR